MCDAKVAKKLPSAIKPVKRRNSEKRKEKSRDAARCRRSKETEIFFEMASQLPLPPSALTQMDKASIMRIAISFLKIRSFVDPDIEYIKKKPLNPMETLYLKSLDGFLLVMSQDGDMVYLSENIDLYLGLSQTDLMGNSIFDYSHPCDHDDIKELLSLKTEEKDSIVPFSLFVRMKNTLNGKGRCLTLRSASYKVIHFTGRILKKPSLKINRDPAPSKEKSSGGSSAKEGNPSLKCFLTIGEPIPHPSNIEVPLGKQTFLSRHSLDMKFTYVDDRIADILGYKSDELLGKSVYLYFHVADCKVMEKSYKILFAKGQCETNSYRFLAKFGGYVWVLTQGTIIYEGSTNKPQCVVCVNYILSEIERKNEIFSADQVVMPETVTPTPPSEIECEPEPELEPEEEFVPSLPQANTNKIFAPRTADMNTGFLTFVENGGSLIVSKEEPEDLTHLAPQAGDVCIPLDMSGVCPDLFEDVLLDDLDSEEPSMLLGEYDNYLLFEKHNNYEDSGSMADHLVTTSRSPLLVDKDPFLTNRDDPLLSSDSGKYLLDSIVNGDKFDIRDIRPNQRRVTSLSSKQDGVGGGSSSSGGSGSLLERLNLVTSKEKEDFSMRAPYIPMSDVIVDDFLLMDSADDPLQLTDIVRKGVDDPLMLSNSDKQTDGFEDSWRNGDDKLSSANIKSDLVKLLKGDVRQQQQQKMRKTDLITPINGNVSKVTVTKNRKGVTVNPVIIRKPNGTMKNTQVASSNPVIITSRVKRDNVQQPNGNLSYLNNHLGPLAKALRQNGAMRNPSIKNSPVGGGGGLRKVLNGYHPNKTTCLGQEDRGGEPIDGLDFEERILGSNGTDIGPPLTSIENERPFPTPPDPPPKRNGSSVPLPNPSDSSLKKLKMDTKEIINSTAQKSVLLNLLLNGEDVTHGYFCQVNSNNNSANQNSNNGNHTTKYNKSTASSKVPNNTLQNTGGNHLNRGVTNGRVTKSSATANQSYLLNREAIMVRKGLMGNSKRATVDLPALL